MNRRGARGRGRRGARARGRRRWGSASGGEGRPGWGGRGAREQGPACSCSTRSLRWWGTAVAKSNSKNRHKHYKYSKKYGKKLQFQYVVNRSIPNLQKKIGSQNNNNFFWVHRAPVWPLGKSKFRRVGYMKRSANFFFCRGGNGRALGRGHDTGRRW